MNLNGFASGNGVRDSSGAIQVNTSPIRAHIFRGGVSGTEKPWYKALKISVLDANKEDFEYVAYLLISYPFMAYYKEKMALVKLSIRRESGARLAILYATDSFDAANVCIKTYDSYSKLELWIKTTVMYDAISVDVISYSCIDPGNFRAHGYGKGITTYTLTGYGQELPSGGTTEGPVTAFTNFPIFDGGNGLKGTIYKTGAITTATWTGVYSPEVTISKSGLYYVKGHFGGIGGNAFDEAQYQILRKHVGESTYRGIAYAFGHHSGTLTSVQASSIEYFKAGDSITMQIWTSVAGAKFNTSLYIVPLMYPHS